MRKLLLMALCLLLTGVSACSSSKPPLEPTQVVDGKSIVMPPEFYVLPKVQKQALPAEKQTDLEETEE